ncbi:FYVE, RhoGEF and PH domain-containing protein 5 [Desmophyllum pertusum]|uniref:FYVE, RhoGEF and PH domain-containing protein 5 n=1 Tax=Desmophyllum pertusum TaxID=174260 RepID=A0A9W9YLU6_9CNID|nr:FYVE, RhoGEF and PH domain-containing protein 5 [Desmophyllum pertusum]
MQSIPSGEKKKKPPVPPKPKGYVPKKVSSPSIVRSINNDKDSVSQPTKTRSGSAPAFSTTSDNRKSQFFVTLENDASSTAPSKDAYSTAPSKNACSKAPSQSHGSRTSSQFFVSVDEQMSGNHRTNEIEGQISSRHISTISNDKAINGAENSTADNIGVHVHENGVAPLHTKTFSSGRKIPPAKILSSGKNLPDPLEGLEITVDALSDDEDDLLSKTVIPEDEQENDHLSDLGDVNGITASDNLDVVMSDKPCDEFKPEDSLSESKQNVKILYSVELEEECSVTMIDDSSRRRELEDDSLYKTTHISQTEDGQQMEEMSTLSNEMDHFVDIREEMPKEKLFEGDFLENSNSEPFPIATDAEVENREELNSIDYVNQKAEDVSEVDVEKPKEDEQLYDIDTILDNLSDDAQEIISEDDASIEEYCEPTVDLDVELEADLHFDNLESHQNEPGQDERNEVITSTATELRQDEPQENSKVIIAEPIREGTFISVTDHVVSESIVEVAEEENHGKCPNEDTQSIGYNDAPENVEFEASASLSENRLVTQTDFENPAADFNDETEEQCHKDDIVQLQPDLAAPSSDEVESHNIHVTAVELNKEDDSEEHLLKDSVPEDVSKVECTVVRTETVHVCSTSGSVHVEAGSEVTTSSAEESTLEISTGAVKSEPVSTEEDAEAKHVPAPFEQVDVEEPEAQENVNTDEPHSPLLPQPVRPERRNRQAKQQKHVYENIDPTKQQPEEMASKNNTTVSLRKTQSFSSYETVVLSLPRPVQRVSDDEAIYRVPSKVIRVDSYSNNDESEYSVPYPIASRNNVIQEEEYAVPKSIVVQACAVTDTHEAYSVPGLVTSVPVIETFAEPSSNGLVHEIPQESDNIYAVPEQVQTRKTVTVTVSTTPPPKPPRTSLLKEDDFKIKTDSEETVSSSSTETTKRESPKPVPRTREQRNSPSPVPRKSSKPAESSGSSPPQGGESPVPVPRSRLNALQASSEAVPNLSSSELSTLSSSEISTALESTDDDELSLKRKAPPRPPPPRASMVNDDDDLPPPLSPGPFGNDMDSDSDSDVGEDAAPKGPPKPKTYHISHEILSTERRFVDALKLVFEECYGTIKSANVVADAVLADIFRDLENIYLLDSKFLQELEERMETWEEHERIGDIIKKYGHFLKMYTQFVNGYDKAMSVFQDTMKENPDFANLVSQFQASERCHGMILSAYMLKPVQRVPSYRLLLIDYLKHLPKDSEEFKDTEDALKIVSEVATHINESMKKMDSFEQMLKLQRMLVGHPEIVKAGRDYLKEGTLMKLCRKDMQERMFFLKLGFLLYLCENKILMHTIIDLQVVSPCFEHLCLCQILQTFVNEFSIISTTRSFTLTASTPEERDKWVEALNHAIDVVTKRKITFVSKTRDAAGLGLQDQDEDVNKLGEKAPVWIPDARVTMCMSCTSPFTLTNRRHHCRGCGNVVCGSCSDSTAPLVYLDYTQARVCDKCYDMLLKEFHTDEIHIDDEEPTVLPPLLQEAEDADKLLRKPTKFEMMRRFRSRKTKRKSQIPIHPSHLTEVVANQEGSQMSGYLKCKKGRHGWKKSWFVLKDNVLYSYKASSDVVALETLPVLSYQMEDLGKEGDDCTFQLKHQGVAPLVFKADNETSGTRWIRELKKAITMEG